MCGFAGLLDPDGRLDEPELLAVADRMAATVGHRGPDDRGCWADPAHGIALGFRRLAIVDLRPTGHQPMVSPSGRYIAVFNGEVYDHARLRTGLERNGVRFRGSSDTEVLLALVDAHGVEGALGRANLMCGLAVWDRQEAALTLARDRLGEKPVMWGWAGSALVFGSELKALRAHPRFCTELDPHAIAAYLRLTYVPHPATVAARRAAAAAWFARHDRRGRPPPRPLAGAAPVVAVRRRRGCRPLEPRSPARPDRRR